MDALDSLSLAQQQHHTPKGSNNTGFGAISWGFLELLTSSLLHQQAWREELENWVLKLHIASVCLFLGFPGPIAAKRKVPCSTVSLHAIVHPCHGVDSEVH